MISKVVVAVVVVLMSMMLFGCQSKIEAENAMEEIAVVEETEAVEETEVAEEITESEINVNLGTSAVYSKEQLMEAVRVIEEDFALNFADCTLLEVEYNEEYSVSMEEVNKEMFQVENAVVFTSAFHVEDDYAGPMEAGTVYEAYEWIMTMDTDGNWSLLTCGY